MAGAPFTAKELAFLETANKQDQLQAGYPTRLLVSRYAGTVQAQAARIQGLEQEQKVLLKFKEAVLDAIIKHQVAVFIVKDIQQKALPLLDKLTAANQEHLEKLKEL